MPNLKNVYKKQSFDEKNLYKNTYIHILPVDTKHPANSAIHLHTQRDTHTYTYIHSFQISI